ncbi:MAG: hypothetical protein A2413_18315 [Treponema sp. RIFOXYC1_FULL_61_9]|nr:MAG: hypothetical protein A2413_18315 [Treponema sp. RIFOXYC1_FULL_61_9]
MHQIELELQNEELRRTHAELDAARARWFDLFDLAPVGYITIDGQGTVTEANLAAANMLGLGRGAMIERSLSGFVLPEDKDVLYLYRKNFSETGFSPDCELRMVKPDGTILWVRLTTAISRNADGSIFWLMTLSDITGLRLETDEQELAAHLILLVDSQGDFRSCMSDLAAALQSWSGCEAVGIRLRDGDDFPLYESRGFSPAFLRDGCRLSACGPDGNILRDGAGNPVLECMCGNVIKGRFDPSKSCFTVRGSFWTNGANHSPVSTVEAFRRSCVRNRCNENGYESVALIRLSLGDEVFGLLQFNDLRPNRFTPARIAHFERMADRLSIALSHRQAEEALRNSEELLSSFIKCSPIYACIREVTPTESRVLMASENFRDMIGIPGSEMIGKSMAALFPPEFARAITADDWTVVSTGKPILHEEELKGRQYTTIQFPIAFGDKKLLAGYTIDMTERNNAEEELRKALEENRNLLRELQHRTKNSLTLIHSLINLSSMAGVSTEVKEVLDELGTRVKSVSELYNLLQHADSYKNLKLDEYCVRIAAPIADLSGNVSFSVETESIVIPVKDAATIGLIVSELMMNALKYAFPDFRRGAIALAVKKTANGALLEIRDDGIGLPEGFALPADAGLGLTLVHELTGQIGGSFKIGSNGKGTCGTVEFPVAGR